MRLIEADALIERIKYCINQGMGASRAYMFMHMIDDAPTIDAVSVVRCKDCKYGEYRADYDDYECNASGCGLVYDAEYFCAEGEREGE